MITTIVEHRLVDQTSGDEVTIDQLNDLSNWFFENIWVNDLDGERRPMNSSNGNDPKTNDTRTITFKRSRILEFFKHSTTDEIVITLGLHNKHKYDGGQPKSYEHKVMVMLSDKKLDRLRVNDKVVIAGVGDGGLDNGKLCPPDTTC